MVLLQNALMDISEDELAALGDEDSSATAPGTRKDTSLTELQSFVDLVYTHGRSVTALQWLPHRKVHKSTHWVPGILVFDLLFCIFFFFCSVSIRRLSCAGSHCNGMQGSIVSLITVPGG